MAVKSVHLMPSGKLILDKGLITYRRGMGKPVIVPVMSALISTDEGRVLFDTGLDPDGLKDPAGTWGDRAGLIHEFQPEDDVRQRLKQLGLEPKDIRWVVNSHLHYDHTGANRFFPQAEFIVQKSEFRFACYPDDYASAAYIRSHFDHNLNYRLIEGPLELVQGVFLIPAPGHTPGNQAMMVKLPQTGTVILTGDTVYSMENVTDMVPAGNCWNMAEAVKSMALLVHLARLDNGKLFITHDPEAEQTLKLCPEGYD